MTDKLAWAAGVVCGWTVFAFGYAFAGRSPVWWSMVTVATIMCPMMGSTLGCALRYAKRD